MATKLTKQFDHILAKLHTYGGQIFVVKFRREHDKVVDGVTVARAGDVRTMRCRLHVKKGVTGAQPNRKEQDRINGVITVFEMSGWDSGYKCIKIKNIIAMSEPVEES